jgi:hypothetical protein
MSVPLVVGEVGGLFLALGLDLATQLAWTQSADHHATHCVLHINE